MYTELKPTQVVSYQYYIHFPPHGDWRVHYSDALHIAVPYAGTGAIATFT